MKKLTAVFILIFSFYQAQNQRFIYEYRFNNDSTALDKPLEKEMVYLDVSQKGSKFYSADNFVADSIIESRNKKNPNSPNFEGIKFGKFNKVVEKSYPDYKILYFDKFDMYEYKISGEKPLNWKILPDKEKIGEFEAQKATVNAFGRNWVAWFVPQIPIPDGPYKFHGLPGLIVKVSDPKDSHVFELKAIKKLPNDWSSETEKKRFNQLISLEDAKYKKVFLENRENPTKGIRQMLSSGMKVMMTDENGKIIDIEEHLRQQEKNQKEENKKNNNILELDLLK